MPNADTGGLAGEGRADAAEFDQRQRQLFGMWADKANWRGTIFLPYYHCREDGRLVVPRTKRWAGWTVNFAHRWAWPMMLASAIVAVGPACLVLWMLGDQSVYTLPAVLLSLALSLKALVSSARYLACHEI